MHVSRRGIETDDWVLRLIESEDLFRGDGYCGFKCGHVDLDDFFQNDALKNTQELFSTTYSLEAKEATEEDLFYPVALVSLCNDSLRLSKEEKKTTTPDFLRVIRNIPYKKRIYPFPAVKIARLGVHVDHQGQDLGSLVLDMLKEFFTTENRTGCRFLTVDAYLDNKADMFYEKNGFEYLLPKKEGCQDETCFMYFDLLRFKRDAQ